VAQRFSENLKKTALHYMTKPTAQLVRGKYGNSRGYVAEKKKK
jgi:hypothetical protein